MGLHEDYVEAALDLKRRLENDGKHEQARVVGDIVLEAQVLRKRLDLVQTTTRCMICRKTVYWAEDAYKCFFCGYTVCGECGPKHFGEPGSGHSGAGSGHLRR